MRVYRSRERFSFQSHQIGKIYILIDQINADALFNGKWNWSGQTFDMIFDSFWLFLH